MKCRPFITQSAIRQHLYTLVSKRINKQGIVTLKFQPSEAKAQESLQPRTTKLGQQDHRKTKRRKGRKKVVEINGSNCCVLDVSEKKGQEHRHLTCENKSKFPGVKQEVLL